jgi:hypothetical protein
MSLMLRLSAFTRGAESILAFVSFRAVARFLFRTSRRRRRRDRPELKVKKEVGWVEKDAPDGTRSTEDRDIRVVARDIQDLPQRFASAMLPRMMNE